MLCLILMLMLRFNRYIVECKSGLGLPLGNQVARFNRYIVECKFRKNRGVGMKLKDLIDT